MLAAEVPPYLAQKKAQAMLPILTQGQWLITADTDVILDGTVLGKPNDLGEAAALLRQMSGRTHDVVTGVCVANLEGAFHTFSDTTKVRFRALSEEMIAYYLQHFRPLDKAGAYGVQEWIGMVAIEGIEGCFYNVMGLPVQRLFMLLQTLLPPEVLYAGRF
jgi:septum formation protein